MASAFATPTGAQAQIQNDKLVMVLTFDVLAMGVDVQPDGFTYFPSSVSVLPTDTAAALRTKVSAQIVADGLSVGLTLPTTQLTLPTYSKG